MPELLRAEGICKQYGGVAALRDAHFSLAEGEVHALMGENGAGKSTLAKILAGSVIPDHGRIFIGGARATIRHPLDGQRLGIGIIYQELDLFPNLTVGENMVIGNLRFHERGFVRFREIEAFCRPYLDRAGFSGSTSRLVTELPIAQRQLVALARALSMNARVILMDEPTSSLTDEAAGRLFDVIAQLRGSGVSTVYVSHKMDEIFRVCDRATILRDGETVRSVEIKNTDPDALIRMMVGRELPPRPAKKTPGAAHVLLAVSHLSTAKLRDVTFELNAGEVLGLAGLVGAGRSELGAALFGMRPRQGGEVRLNDATIAPHSPAEAIRLGIGLVPEDRKLQGLMRQMSVLENSAMTRLGRSSMLQPVQSKTEASLLQPIYRQLALRAGSLSAEVRTLSGGNQQKALLARWLLADPVLLFLDDPARGIDVAAKQDIYRIIDELAGAGKGIILVSSELPELMRCSDRILVLCEGRVTGVFDAAHTTEEEIMRAATAFTTRGAGV